jgi:hypothetical protein
MVERIIASKAITGIYEHQMRIVRQVYAARSHSGGATLSSHFQESHDIAKWAQFRKLCETLY